MKWDTMTDYNQRSVSVNGCLTTILHVLYEDYHKNYSEAWLPYCFIVLNASPDKETKINSGIPMKKINAILN